jgi:hypothetical protein
VSGVVVNANQLSSVANRLAKWLLKCGQVFDAGFWGLNFFL